MRPDRHLTGPFVDQAFGAETDDRVIVDQRLHVRSRRREQPELEPIVATIRRVRFGVVVGSGSPHAASISHSGPNAHRPVRTPSGHLVGR